MRLESEMMKKAPKKGTALIYFRGGIYYGGYEIEEALILEEKEPEDEILELHLFDEQAEYRRIWSEERQGYIEALITDQAAESTELLGKEQTKYYDMIMEESPYLTGKGESERIRVIHYMKYDEDDRLNLVNYRLSVWKEGKVHG